MHIPSRVEVLSWNENQVADLLREHNLLDCVDCIFQRHIDGQKLLYLKEGDVMYFLEIHDQRSRGKFWNIVKQITEKQGKKGGVNSLMNKFQDISPGRNNNPEEEDECSDSSDSFESDYDEPDPEVEPKPQSSISLERRETIRQNLLKSLMPKPAAPPPSQDDYPEPEDIYDLPEDGFGEPEDMYDVPSDESGGGVVGRHPALERKESDQYLIPDDKNLFEVSLIPDEENYEDLSGASPPMGNSTFDEEEEYVVPGTNPGGNVPPRPPKLSHDTKPSPPVKNGHSHREPKPSKNNGIQKLQAMFQEQENYEPPQPQRDLKKQRPLPKAHPSGPPKPPAKPSASKAPPQPPRIPKKTETKPPVPVELEQEDEYEPPNVPPPSTGKKPPTFKPAALKPPTFKPPQAQEPPVRPLKNKPPEPEQENYEPPVQPPRHPKKPAVKPPVEIEQENYEPPEVEKRNKKPVVPMDPEESYEDPNQISVDQADSEEWEQEDYEIPDTSDRPKPPAPQVTPKKSHFNLFHRSPSKKVSPPPKADKKKTSKKEVPDSSLPTPSPPVPENKHPPSKSIIGKLHREKADKRNSLLPSLPTDKVDSKSQGSESPTLLPKPLPAKPLPAKPLPAKPLPERSLPEKPAKKEALVANQRHKPEPPRKDLPKSKTQLLQSQPWFHGSVSKSDVATILKSTKKDGAYLVRNSSKNPGQYTMSILYKGDIRHLNMPVDANGHYRLGDSGVERFKNIEELVTYFKKHDVEFSAGGKTPLTHACCK